MNYKNITGKILTLVILFLPIIFYSYIQFRFSANIPILDDYDAVLNFLNNFLESDNLADKLRLIFSQHNEHRIVFTRIVVLAQYYIFGQVNFAMLAFLGNLGWYFTIPIFFLLFKKLNLSLFYFLPVPYLAFQLCHYSISWSMMTLQNYYVVLFAICSFYFLTEKENLFNSLIFSIMAFFTSGSGVIVPFMAIFYLFLQKKWKDMFVVICISCFLLIIYFANYIKPEGHPSIAGNIKNIGNLLLYFFAYLGSLIKYKWAAVFFGLLTFIYFIYFVIKKYHSKYIFFFLILTYVLLTGFILSFTRSGFGFTQATSSRYTIYSVISLIAIYLISLHKFKNYSDISKLSPKKFAAFVLFFSLIYNISTNIYNFRKLQVNYDDLLNGADKYVRSGDNSMLSYPDKAKADAILVSSKKNNIFNIE
jgi:hypothetical protein